MNTVSSATASPPATQTSRRPDSAIQLNKPRDQRAMSHHHGSSVVGSTSFQRSELMVRTVARFGSFATLSSAFLTSGRVGTSPGAMNGVSGCATPVNGTSATTAMSMRSGRKRTPQLLLHVPRLELGAAVQVHREARRNVERLE